MGAQIILTAKQTHTLGRRETEKINHKNVCVCVCVSSLALKYYCAMIDIQLTP